MKKKSSTEDDNITITFYFFDVLSLLLAIHKDTSGFFLRSL